VLVTYRPGYHPPWLAQSYATQIALSPLRAEDSRTVVQAVLQAASVPATVVQEIVTQVAGNPFFLEELAWHVIEHGGQPTPLAVPQTIEAVLAARIDRLPPEEKRLLQERRRVLHGRTAQAIDALFAERLPEHYYALAHHYSRNGHTAEAVDYLQRAGLQAVERSAYAEAVSHLTTALDLLLALPETRQRSQLQLGVQMTLGIAPGHQDLATSQATEATRDRSDHLVLLAETFAQVGQITKGLEALAEGLPTVAKNRIRWWEAELYRLRGELLLQQTVVQPEEAEVCFQQALAVARGEQAKSWELRAATSLARLWQRQGKQAAAHELIAPVYGWFTEGFDTVDLRDAKILLEELEG
jgi:predicted ATPase